HEAIRLGASVVGADIDPIPVIQARATLSDTPLDALEQAFSGLMAALRGALSDHYSTSCPHCAAAVEMQFMLYGLRRYCDCGSRLFVDSFALRQEVDDSQVR